MSKSIGLPFSASLIPKVLDGSKQQTRRIPGIHNCRLLLGDKDRTGRMKGLDWSQARIGANLDGSAYSIVFHPKDNLWYELAPRHEPGDIAWMREKHCFVEHDDGRDFVKYLADGVEYPIPNAEEYCDYTVGRYDTTRASIHMPRWASRWERPLKSVRIELIQDISEDDARAEGTPEELWYEHGSPYLASGALNPLHDPGDKLPTIGFRKLWDSINASRGWAWSKNLPVVVYQW